MRTHTGSDPIIIQLSGIEGHLVTAQLTDPDDPFGPPAAEYSAETADEAVKGLIGIVSFQITEGA